LRGSGLAIAHDTFSLVHGYITLCYTHPGRAAQGFRQS
jgi:hypothetical protein